MSSLGTIEDATELFMPWQDGYGVGIRVLDAQHEHLVGSLNALYAGLQAGTDLDRLAQLLAGLVQDTHMHFTAEETLLQAHGYPDVATHQFAHAQLLRRLREFQDAGAVGSPIIHVGMLTFLKSWWTHHLLGTDKTYGPFLAGTGAS